MSAGSATVGVDLGGTKTLVVGMVDGEVVATAKRSTPRVGTPADVVARVAATIDRLALPVPIGRVGLGGPGPTPGGTRLGPAPNLPGWDEPVDVAALLSVHLPGAAVRVGNDVNVAALAEWQLGAGEARHDLLAVFVGTGVGGGLVLDGRVRRGAHGVAGEIGHLTVVPDGEPCGCGGRGHVESYAGRAGMERIARRRHAAGEPTLLVDLAGEDGRIRSSIVEKALARGDEMAAELVAAAATAVGRAVAAVTLVADVEVVAVGGGLGTRLGQDFLGAIEVAAAEAVPFAATPRMSGTWLGDDAGALGAALLVEGPD